MYTTSLPLAFFFFRFQLLLPAAQKILAFVYSVAHPHQEEGVVRTSRAGRKICPVKEAAGFIHQSEIGCPEQILVKVSQSHGLRMFKSLLNMGFLELLRKFSMCTSLLQKFIAVELINHLKQCLLHFDMLDRILNYFGKKCLK